MKALSFGPIVVRKGGADRYETAALLSALTFPKTGAVSCPGVGFFPGTSSHQYAGAAERWHLSLSIPVQSFFCELSLPHRATVTKLSAGIDDTSATLGTTCQLRRIDIIGGRAAAGIGSLVIMAATLPTSGSSGGESVSTTAIDQPVVDNARYGYYIGCPTNEELRIIGATVEYELTA